MGMAGQHTAIDTEAQNQAPHKGLYDRAVMAIAELFQDGHVSINQTLASLCSLRDEVDRMIDMLKEDLAED